MHRFGAPWVSIQVITPVISTRIAKQAVTRYWYIIPFLTDHTPHRRLFGIVHVEMNHTWRQSGEVRPTNLLVFIGYSIVTLPSSSTYFSATQFCRIASSFTASSGQKQRPSPCATHTPSNASEKASGHE